MSTYDSLLLSYGGGIISDKDKSKQFGGAAALIIGIGGTGMAALSNLKAKVYQQLEPDDPSAAVPTYKRIQFLGIDSDETDREKQRGAGKLTEDEFLSVKNPNLKDALSKKRSILNSPEMNWMEIDNIGELNGVEGAGGVRQVGRYLLISKAGSLYNKIKAKCTEAKTELGRLGSESHLDVYIFAGISGGTGSGCFLDTCYIVRKVLDDTGWSAQGNIMGFFFLPDVVTSKPEVAAKDTVVAYNNSNGYAAMKELDYLMSLQNADDWFEQNYGPFKIRTQYPPVDMCHLISATKSDGSMIPNAFGYGINVAADYVMAYLADVDLGGASAGDDDGGMTMQGHLANVKRGVDTIARRHGANLSYHILGAANAEIPMTQIATYLAAGLYEKFQKAVDVSKFAITKEDIDSFCFDIGLTWEGIYQEVTNNCPQLQLSTPDKKQLRQYGTMPDSVVPGCWGTEAQGWEQTRTDIQTKNSLALSHDLDCYNYEKVTDDSLIGRTFRALYRLCLNPSYGPYYAAALLDHAGYDMMAAASGIIEGARLGAQQWEAQKAYEGSLIPQASVNFMSPLSTGKAYNAYRDVVRRFFEAENEVEVYKEMVTLLEDFKRNLEELQKNYFAPLCELLDRLKETFQENRNYLASPAAKKPTSYTWQILQLSDVQEMLDRELEKLAENQYMVKFMQHLLQNHEAWRTQNEAGIVRSVREYMGKVFRAQIDRSLQTYLFQRYPQANNDNNLLADIVKKEIMETVHRMAVPMFWRNPSFTLDSTTSFPNCSLSVPLNAVAVCQAADAFKGVHSEEAAYAVRKTGLKDRIFAMRLNSGIPFYAYHGVTLLKGEYDKAAHTAAGVGAHLYAYTGRGEIGDNSGRKDWRNFLPTPMPYSFDKSMVAEGEELAKLYDKGEAYGVIAVNDQGKYVIYKSRQVEVPIYTLDDFLENGELVKARLDEALEKLREIKNSLYAQGYITVNLKNDGAQELGQTRVDEVRRDYFIHYPKLQEDVRLELEKLERLNAAITALEQIEAENQSYETELKQFCDLLFYKTISCVDAVGSESYEKIAVISHTYRNSYDDEVTLEFSARRDTMPYAEEFPLYQAFLTYRSLNANAAPRRDLDKAAKERDAGKKGEYDNVVGFTLEKAWTKEAMDDLVENKMRSLSKQEIKDVLRFYNGLRRCIRRFKNQFSADQWRRLPGQVQTGQKTQPVPQTPPVQKEIWTVWGNGRYLYIYRQYGLNQAWDDAAKTWVPLTPDMWVYDDQGQPHPITLDANGYFRP